ncbi:hypothetical protein [Dictyobacter aurantiacus]|uniref:Uncharacterized protein n=1 Tax=Dictyobacter aurantiacus TaxID=1936993 RepID=A0A401ZD67_9CHLR|nr:hypothetical protein [Dictyobacter aurantiacus]GCE04789.1 hypothetical protein KDAU_21180 [Dictyobacter aurantiacus]
MSDEFMDINHIEKVKDALEDDQYNWRTVDGVANQLGISSEDVRKIINGQLRDQVVRTYDSNLNSAVYTTRKHYGEKESTLNRLLSAFTNRVV